MDLWLAIALMLLGLSLVTLEVFFPSGGLLGFLATCAIVGSIVLGFRCEPRPVVGIVLLLTSLVGVPTVLVVALAYLPKTSMGRKVLLLAPTAEDVLPDSPKRRELKKLIGQVGRAKSKMLPSGVIVVAGKTIDASSEGMAIEPGQAVRVIEVRGTRVIVRPVDEGTSQPSADDPLARPVDSVVEDPFDEPPG